MINIKQVKAHVESIESLANEARQDIESLSKRRPRWGRLGSLSTEAWDEIRHKLDLIRGELNAAETEIDKPERPDDADPHAK
jgi:hypothetical protein